MNVRPLHADPTGKGLGKDKTRCGKWVVEEGIWEDDYLQEVKRLEILNINNCYNVSNAL